MSTFTIRVELYGNPGKDIYTLLHDAMEASQFSSSIVFCGILYLLPKAEFMWKGIGSVKAVEAMVVQAVLPVWKDFAIMVTKTEEPMGFHNLKPVGRISE